MSVILYGNSASGHSYKPALFLALAAIPHEYRAVNLQVARSERAPDFVAVSPYGEVPVLVEAGVSLAQSNAILLHLARRHHRFGARDEAGWDRLTQWLFWEANRVGFSVPNLRAVYRYARDTPADVVRWLHARAVDDLGRLEGELQDKAFLLGVEPTIADIACSAYLFWLGEAGIDVAEVPAIGAWLDRIRALPGWRPAEDLLA
ncbi:MAG: glutathione S-transferase family protein [Byssovorax sp.]